ncbi:MAG: prolipoprotein diacylglyceryl transferase family protein [Candidatus Gracilibacteria bacterium]|jgi:phosphatidylglycerol:prolipoprotein diacylglycerol transferase
MIPLILDTKFFAIYTLWVFIAIAIVASIYTLIKLGLKNGLKLQFLSDNSAKIFLIGIIGARIVSVAANYQTYFYELNWNNFLSVFYIWDKNLNIWAGIGLALFYLYKICKKEDQDFLKWMDVIIPSIIVGISIGCIGAFFDGINYGKETSLPWGVNFENPSVKYIVPIHPTQIYAFLYSALISVFLLLTGQRKDIEEENPPGITAFIGIFLFSLMKFLEEFLRGDDTLMISNIRISQIITFIILISSGIIIFKRYNKHTKKFFKRKLWKK